MKFKFFMAFILIGVNCQTAERNPDIQYRFITSIPFKKLEENPEFSKLIEEIKNLKNQINIFERDLNNIKNSVIFDPYKSDDGQIINKERADEQLILEMQQKIQNMKIELAQKREQRKKLLLQLDPNCEIVSK